MVKFFDEDSDDEEEIEKSNNQNSLSTYKFIKPCHMRQHVDAQDHLMEKEIESIAFTKGPSANQWRVDDIELKNFAKDLFGEE